MPENDTALSFRAWSRYKPKRDSGKKSFFVERTGQKIEFETDSTNSRIRGYDTSCML